MENINNNNVEEIWKTLDEFPYIKISNLGNIEKLPHKWWKGGIMPSHIDKDGYIRVTTTKKDGKKRTIGIHQLVALAFVNNDNPEIRKCVNHIDSNRTNNRFDNLEWVSPRENVRHSIQNGNRKLAYDVPKKSTLTLYQIDQINFLRQYYNVKELSKLFNIKYTTLKNIIRKQKQSEILDNQQPNPKYVVGEVQRV